MGEVAPTSGFCAPHLFLLRGAEPQSPGRAVTPCHPTGSLALSGGALLVCALVESGHCPAVRRSLDPPYGGMCVSDEPSLGCSGARWGSWAALGVERIGLQERCRVPCARTQPPLLPGLGCLCFSPPE